MAQGTLDYQYTRTRSGLWLIVAGSMFVVVIAAGLLFRYRRRTQKAGLALAQT
ncbi:hypothetical protein RMSM_02189 [Rhodopirellula maiorica SM1]|uniref:Uncharacterized protein n=1 Tax=Rhodopirellula maiorica SM1 TaxID=1265738 RepID=M5RNK8_9BACT|nr:hypothetical protein RMSM_02189 [Rhodopirellula maiorica SM1]